MDQKFLFFTSEGLELLKKIYGEKDGKECYEKVVSILPKKKSDQPPQLPIDEKDVFLITYGDSLLSRSKDSSTLQNLKKFLFAHLKGLITNVHILPFFPFTSDDGFSISDYYEVNPELGTWKDFEEISKEGKFKMMADLVLNHCSKSHNWFQSFLTEKESSYYDDFFIEIKNEKEVDLSSIVRPRNLPLLHSYKTIPKGLEEKRIWTTFSEDQVDLNFKDIHVLIEFIKIFQFFVQKGIQVVRLDAIAYIWKEIGHPSIHHENVHRIVKVFRLIINEFYPSILLLTETNVPHQENIRYFGNTKNEAQMIYQFSLPPLTLHAFITSNVSYLKKWMNSIPSYQNCTYFNFLASHDGIGVTPLHGILEEEEIEKVLKRVKNHKGKISYKAIGKEKTIPYELNINYRDAICELDDALDHKTRAKKFLASQSMLMIVVGTPAIYIHSLLGSGNDLKGAEESGINRRINREKLILEDVLEELEDPTSTRSLILEGFKHMIRARATSKAFHPSSPQKAIDNGNDAVLTLLRWTEKMEKEEKVLAFVNTSKEKQEVTLENMFDEWKDSRDLLSIQEQQSSSFEIKKSGENDLIVTIEGYGIVWLSK